MVLKRLTPSRFHEFVEISQEASFLQTREMAHLLEKRGFQVYFLGLEKEGQLQVAALLYTMKMTGGLHMEINGGPVSRSPHYLGEFYRELQLFAKREGALQVIVKPYDTYQTFDSEGEALTPADPTVLETLQGLGYQHDGLLTGYPGGEPDWLFVKYLEGLTPANLQQSFDKKAQKALKKARTFPIRVRPLKREELSIFKDVTSQTASRQEFVDKPLDYYQDLYDSFGNRATFMVATLDGKSYQTDLSQKIANLEQELVQLKALAAHKHLSSNENNRLKTMQQQLTTLQIRQQEACSLLKDSADEQVLAASLFLFTPQEVVYLFGGSYKEWNKFYAPALLQEFAMQEALKRGISTYNFLGITGRFDGSDGVLRFKQQFKGLVIRKLGTFRYYPNPIKVKILQTIKRLLKR